MPKVSVEKISNVKCLVKVEVPANEVTAAFEKQINLYGKKANIKGFRQGKVPLNLIKQHYGADARKEALSELIQTTLSQAIQEHQLKPIGMPQVEPKAMLEEQPFEYTASFEVLPEVDQINFNIDQIEKLEVDVTDEDINKVIEQLIKQHTEWTLVERPAELKDRVVIDYYAIYEGEPDIKNKIEDFPLELGSQSMIPGFEEALVGIKKDEEKTLKLTFPTDFKIADKAGKPVDFIVQAKNIYEAYIPGLDEAFIKRLGVESGLKEDLKAQISQSLQQEKDRLLREKLKNQVFQLLLDQNPIEVPEGLVERETQAIHDELHPEKHDHHNHSADEIKMYNDIAKKRVALGILVAEYAKKNHLKPDKTRIMQRIQEIASAYQSPEEVIKWLSSDERRANIEAQVMEDQILDHLIKDLPTNNKKISYAELKNIRVY